MKALLLTDYRKLVITDFPEPRPAPGEVLIRVGACGICGSDVHGYDGSSRRRIPPLIMGHEAAGTITSTGSGVTQFAVGDRVTFDSTVYCGACEFCRRNEVNLCEYRQVLGVSCAAYRRHGAFAEFVTVPERIVHALPPGMPFEHAAILEATAVALHAIRMAGEIGTDATALVVGAGMIGLLTMQAARVAGFSRTFVADIDRTRLDLAAALSHDTTLQGSDCATELLRMTDGRGVDVVFEAVGANDTVQSAIASVRRGGTVVLIGNIAPQVTLPLQSVVTRQIRLQGTAASSGEYTRSIELIGNGSIRVAPLISAVAPLHEGPEWFERLYGREPGLMKVVLDPTL
jgi:L-iditol 2-dehydrogenase